MTTIKKYVFGYGSLINCTSASKALDRKVLKEDMIQANLENFQRSWSIWDDVFSDKLQRKVKGVYLNIYPSQGNYVNGIIMEVNKEELKNLSVREKNYDCVNVTNFIDFTNNTIFNNFEVYTFIGKDEHLLKGNIFESYIFENYIKIVDIGLKDISGEFRDEFYETTLVSKTPLLDGNYSFVDFNQQNKV